MKPSPFNKYNAFENQGNDIGKSLSKMSRQSVNLNDGKEWYYQAAKPELKSNTNLNNRSTSFGQPNMLINYPFKAQAPLGHSLMSKQENGATFMQPYLMQSQRSQSSQHSGLLQRSINDQ